MSRPIDPCDSLGRRSYVSCIPRRAHPRGGGKKVSVPPGHAASVKETGVGGCADCRCQMALAPHAGQERKTESLKDTYKGNVAFSL